MQVQEYLDIWIPKNIREKVTFLDISGSHMASDNRFIVFYRLKGEESNWELGYDDLEGELDLTDFINLEKLSCGTRPDILKITKLKLDNCRKLVQIFCSATLLYDLSRCYQLEVISVDVGTYPSGNWSFDLSFFARFPNLKGLDLGVISAIPNKITGSLQSLKELKQLQYLCIGGHPRITEGLEHLPYEKLAYFGCHNTVFKEQLKPLDYDVKTWKLIHILIKGLENEKDNLLVFNKEKKLYVDLLDNTIIESEKLLEDTIEKRNELATKRRGSAHSKSVNKIARLKNKIELLKNHKERLLLKQIEMPCSFPKNK